MSSLQEGMSNGESIAELSERVRAEFNSVDSERARRIAMTETAAAYGTARQAAQESSGVPYKKWLTSGNANVRPAHQAANGQIAKVDEPFTVMDEELMYPGDPNGSAGNIINCHCVAIATTTPPEEESNEP
jgi:SPP1 gp7 family putative phage head morphogenesis protein